MQEGRFYLGTPEIGNSCHIVFLRCGIGTSASELGEVIVKLWAMLNNLKKGIVEDLKGVHPKNLHPGNLVVSIGYGPQVFSIKDIKNSCLLIYS